MRVTERQLESVELHKLIILCTAHRKAAQPALLSSKALMRKRSCNPQIYKSFQSQRRAVPKNVQST